MRNKLCLGISDAQKIVAAAKVEAENNKWAVSIAVVDDGGFLVALERLDGAVGQSAGIATLKAQTAAMARTPTKALEDVVKERPATGAFPGRLSVQGGVPILVNGECVGAVGVSGVKSFEDEQVAKAGLRAIE
ncbi:MAG: heme-binding protein [Acidobacteriia bacterium]|nr:heme-binding protein [Terriglobia bacterium]